MGKEDYTNTYVVVFAILLFNLCHETGDFLKNRFSFYFA